MIVTEYYETRPDDVILERTYSDDGRYVVRDGCAYTEAIDPQELHRAYTEGDLIEG